MDGVVVITIPQIIVTCIAAMGIPSALTGYLFKRHEKRVDKKEAQREQERIEKEKHQEEYQLLILENINASIALGEATARAVQRIPDAKCNGDMHAALEYAQKVKHEQKNFLRKQAVENLHEKGSF